MGREIRKVPKDWEHPKDDNGRYIPLYDRLYRVAAEEWLDNCRKWQDSTHPDLEGEDKGFKEKYPFFWDWDGNPPNLRCYRTREWTAEEANCFQIYETVSAGTPTSPVFESKEDLVAWLVEQGYSSEAASSFAVAEWVPSGAFISGQFYSGIAIGDVLTNKEQGNG